MLELWNPWAEFEGLRRAVDRAAGVSGGDAWMAVPPARLDENELGWRLSLDLPGVTPEDLDVEQEGARVRVRARRRLGEERAVHLERTLQLPSTADLGRIDARLEHGVLTLTVPRAERYRPRRLTVDVGAGTAAGADEVVDGDARAIEAGRQA